MLSRNHPSVFNHKKTYEETLLKVVDLLNETTEQVNTLTDTMNYLQEQGLSDEVINNINTKISDGTIGSLINGTLLGSINTQVNDNTKLIKDITVNVKDKQFGAKGDGTGDDSLAFNSALSYLKSIGGGTLLVPIGVYNIKSTILVPTVGIYIKSASPYKSRISADPTFLGAELIRFEQTGYTINKSIGIDGGLYVDCNNVNAHGITVVNGYDQVSFRNVEVRNINDNYIGFNLIQQNSSQLGQTVLFENCIGEHYGNTSTKPIYYLEKYQECNFVGVKGFGAKVGTGSGGIGFHFKDCRGITLLGCSGAFSTTGILIEALTRNSIGINLVGNTYESITGDCIKTIGTSSFTVQSLHVKGIRDQGGAGNINLFNTTNSHIDADNCPVIIDSTCSNIYVITNVFNNVTDNGSKTTIMALRNFNDNIMSVNNGFATQSDNSPSYELKIKGSNKKIRMYYSATASTDFGFKIDMVDSNNVGSTVLKSSTNDLSLYAKNVESFKVTDPAVANNVGLLVYVNNGGTKVLQQVSIGSIDSGGVGYKVLRVPN